MLKLIFSMTLWAQVVIIPGPEVPEADLIRQLDHNPHHLAFDQAYRQVEEVKKQKLLHHLKKGQFYFLEGELEKAEQEFSALADMKWNVDWPDAERKVIHFALFRLAQLSSTHEKRHQLLMDALDLDPHLQPDTQVFPPPLIELYKSLKHKDELKVFNLPERAENFEHLLINGRILPGRVSFLKDRDRKVRITFLSRFFAPKVLLTELSQLESLKLELNPLAGDTQNCLNPKWAWPLPPPFKMKLMDSSCDELKPLAVPDLPESERPANGSLATASKRSLWRSPWLWAGVSVLTTGLILHHQMKTGSDSGSATNAVPVYTNQPTN